MITKTKFKEYIRCPRYCALEEIYEKKNPIVSFEDAILFEDQAKKLSFYSDMIDESGEKLLTKEDPQLETMMPYYKKVEDLTVKKIRTMYQGEIIHSMNTKEQKPVQVDYDGYHFVTFLDAFLTTPENEYYVFESKATTDKKFKDYSRTIQKEKIPFFVQNEQGIYVDRESLGLEGISRTKLLEMKTSLLDPNHNLGKYIIDIAFSRFIIQEQLRKEGRLENLSRYHFFLTVLNSDYKQTEFDESGTPIYQDSIISLIDVTHLLSDLQDAFLLKIKEVISYLEEMKADPTSLSNSCGRKKIHECKFFPVCFKDHGLQENGSIFEYLYADKGFVIQGERKTIFEMIDLGYKDVTSIPKENLDRINNQIQWDSYKNHKEYWDFEKIKKGLEGIHYPIYHLDFESFPCPLPRFYGESPYTQSLFQFSLHIEHTPGELTQMDQNHYEFLPYDCKDHRREMMEYLISCIQDDGGSVLVYNQNFERTRLQEMAILFPDLSEKLLQIRDRVFDLMFLLKGDKAYYEKMGFKDPKSKTINFYSPDLHGSYSIKKVLPIFTDFSYSMLEVQNGTQALVTYAKFDQMEPKKLEKTHKEMLRYCQQDTWSMVLILSEIIKRIPSNIEKKF